MGIWDNPWFNYYSRECPYIMIINDGVNRGNGVYECRCGNVSYDIGIIVLDE